MIWRLALGYSLALALTGVSLALASGCSGQPPRRAEDAAASAAPAQAPASQGAQVVIAVPGGELTVDAEVVATPAAIEKGLMFREYLAPNAGMLFLMGKDRDWSFWMRNTLIPLDMIFITKDLMIAGIVENAVPRTEDPRLVGAESRYVLEVNGGWSATHHVKAGQRVRFVGVPSQPPP